MSDWQGMDAAPLDETEVLIWAGGFGPGEKGQRAFVAHFFGGGWRETTLNVLIKKPIAWKPIEAPQHASA